MTQGKMLTKKKKGREKKWEGKFGKNEKIKLEEKKEFTSISDIPFCIICVCTAAERGKKKVSETEGRKYPLIFLRRQL